MPSFGFCGPSYQTRSINSDVERSLNLYPEFVESGENASHGSKWVLYRTPGKQLFCALDDGPIACVTSSNEQFLTFDVTPIYFVVAGSTLYSIAVHYDGTSFTGVPTTIGTVDQKGGLPGGALFPAQIIVLNTNLLFVVANGKAFVAAFGPPIVTTTLNFGGLGYSVGDTGIITGSNGLDAKYRILTVDVTPDGTITSSSINNWGSGYAVGDTGTLTGSTGVTADYKILGIDPATGAVVFYTLSSGNGYTTGLNVATATGGAQPGSGTGFTINILTVSNDSGAVLTYTITDVGSGYSIGANVSTTPAGAQPGSGDGNFTVNITAVGAAVWQVVRQAIPDGTLPDDNYVQSATYMDDSVIVGLSGAEPDPQRRQFFVSGLNDPSSWSPLDVGKKEGNSDPMVAVFAAYEVLGVFGLTTMELWLDNPNGPAFPYQRLQGGGVINVGLASPWTICTMDNSVVFLGNDMQGQLVMWQLRGQTPVRISNHAVEYQWRNYDVTGSNMYSYQLDGHYFGVLHFPIPDKTWVFDINTLDPSGKPCWHERASWDGFNFHADIGRFHAWSFPVAHVVGDYRNNNLYIMSNDINTDNCDAIRWLRITPHIFDEQRRVISSRFRLYMQTGLLGTNDDPNPQVSLRISNDGGYTWGPYLTVSAGTIGQYDLLVEWYRMGISRNRVYEVSGNSVAPVALVDAFVEAIPTVTR